MTDLECIEAAREMYASDDVMIDADAEVSWSDEGAFVQAWVWVPTDASD